MFPVDHYTNKAFLFTDTILSELSSFLSLKIRFQYHPNHHLKILKLAFFS